VERGCLNEGTVVAFLQGGLAAATRSLVEDHVAGCNACAELVTWAAADQGNTSRPAGREGRPLVGQLAPGSSVDRYQILGAAAGQRRVAGRPIVMQNELGRPTEALATANRAVGIFVSYGDPDNEQCANAYNSVGEALILLGRYAEAERPFAEAARITRQALGARHFEIAYPLFGLGRVMLAAGDPAKAVPLLEESLSIREDGEPDPVRIADTRFVLARALWDSGRDRRRAIALATSANDTFARQDRLEQGRAVTSWLAARNTRHR